MKNIEELLETPYWIIDILPEQVPDNAGGQYFAIEQYYLQSPRREMIHRKYADILLRLNCYFDMAVSFDPEEDAEDILHGDSSKERCNPDPESFAEALHKGKEPGFLRVLFPSEDAMIDFDFGDTSMTVYNPSVHLLELLQKLTSAAGVFLWRS